MIIVTKKYFRLEDFCMIYGKNKPGFLSFEEFYNVFLKEVLPEIKNLIQSCNYEKSEFTVILKKFFQIFGK